MTDDAELLRRYADARSQEAFTELVERHVGLVYHAALRRTGRPHLAEEAAQYVFIALARNAPALSRHAALSGWLYTTTRFAANRILRTERRRQFREQEAYAMQDTLSPPNAEWDRLRPALDGVMDQLPERDRAAVLLRYFEGRSFADVGAALQLTEEAARKRVERGIGKLHSLLLRRGITSTSAALAVMLSSQAGLAAPAGLAATVAGSALAAGGIAGSAAAVGLIGFMTTTKAILGIAGVIGILALGTAGYEFRAARRAESAKAAATQELDLQAKHLRTVTQQAEATERTAADLQKSLNGLQTAAPSRSKWDAAAEGRKFLAAHPEARAVLEKLAKHYTTARYGPFLQSLELTSAQIEELENKLEKIQSKTVLPTPAGNLELSLDDSTQANEPLQDQLREALGDSLYQQLRNYQGSRDRLNGAQMVANRVASDAYFTATPLTGSQAGQLLQILANNNPEYQSGGTTNRMAAFDWNAVLSQAQDVLAPAQLASLQSFQAEQAYQTALQAAQQAAQAAGNSAP